MRRSRSIATPMKLTAFLVAAALVLAACSSSAKSGGSSSSAAGSSSAAATGASSSASSGAAAQSLPTSGPGTGTGTIKVGVQCQPGGYQPSPECLPTFQAAAAYANSNGGINGYKIEIDNCITSTDPTDVAASAQCLTKQITQNGDQVIIGLNGGVGDTAILDAHNIPVINPIDVEPEFDSAPMSFPIYGWQASAWGTMVQYLATQGIKTPAVTDTQNTIGAAAKQAVIDAYKSLNITPKVVPALLTAVSFQPQVELMQSEGVDAVYPVLAPASTVAIAQEADAIGYHPAIGTIWNAYDQKDEKTLSTAGAASKIYTTAPFKSYDSDTGNLLQSTVNKYAPSAGWDFSFQSIVNWIGMEILFQALTKMSGPATSANIVTQLKSQTFTSEWLPKSVSWNNTSGPSCQIAGDTAYVFQLVNGKWSQVGDTYDVPPGTVANCGKGS